MNSEWQTVPQRNAYRGGRPQYGRPRPYASQPPLPPPETPLKKTEANFPKLVPAAPKKSMVVFDNSFSKTVNEMAAAEEEQRLRDNYAKEQADKAQTEFRGVYILGSIRTDTVRNTVRNFVRDLSNEFDEQAEFEREEYDTAPPPPSEEDDGWSTVKQKTIRPKRELTVAELDAKYRAAGDAAARDEEEFNGDLFDASSRRNHY